MVLWSPAVTPQNLRFRLWPKERATPAPTGVARAAYSPQFTCPRPPDLPRGRSECRQIVGRPRRIGVPQEGGKAAPSLPSRAPLSMSLPCPCPCPATPAEPQRSSTRPMSGTATSPLRALVQNPGDPGRRRDVADFGLGLLSTMERAQDEKPGARNEEVKVDDQGYRANIYPGS